MPGKSLTALGSAARVARSVGAGTLLRAARDGADSAFVALGRPPLHVRVDGIELRGFLRHRSFLGDLAEDSHEPFLRRLILQELRPETVFVDVGAHVGLYSLLAAPHVQRVVAFEADPYTARALAVNVRRTPNVHVVAKAASDQEGRAGFYPSPGTYGSSLFQRPGMTGARAIEIEATTVDAEAAGARDVVAKIDAEGAELQVLGGAEKTLREADRAVLVVEVNPSALADAAASSAALIAQLRALGFELWRVDESEAALVPLTAADTGAWKGNLVARR